MRRTFVCLANSKKYIERCVAGIELEASSEKGFSIVKKNNLPKWIRPITDTETGAVPEQVVKNMGLMDIYEVEILEEKPKGYQSENVLFNLKSLRKIQASQPSIAKLDRLRSPDKLLFGNSGKAISVKAIQNIKHSLMLIKVERPIVHIKNHFNEITEISSTQIRLDFLYDGIDYNLPITDVAFLKHFSGNPYEIQESFAATYICVSLGMEHRGWHYKLVAGIIGVKE
jgi:hypothetical protein